MNNIIFMVDYKIHNYRMFYVSVFPAVARVRAYEMQVITFLSC